MSSLLAVVLSAHLHLTFKHPGVARQPAFTPDGQLIATSCVDGTVALRHLPDGQLVRTSETENPEPREVIFALERSGTRYAAPSLVLQARRRQAGKGACRPLLDPKIARFGFTATKKLGGAVVRNQMLKWLSFCGLPV